ANSSQHGGPTTITLTVSDGGNLTSTTFTVTVAAVNDAPTWALPSARVVDEDTVLVLSGADAPVVADLDAGAASVRVTLTATQGLISLGATTGLSFITGTGSANASMSFSGSLSAINAALDGLRFAPGANFNGAAQIDLLVNDLGNSGSGGAKSASGSIAITVLAVNDAPTLGLPGPQATPLATALYFSSANGNAVTVGDVDAGSGLLDLTVSTELVGNGRLGFGSLAGITLISGGGSDDTAVTLRGNLSDLNAALGTLRFTATAGGPARIDLTIDDRGNSGSGGTLTKSGVIAITVADGQLPQLTLSRSSLVYTENSGPVALDAGLTVSDADSATLASARIWIGSGFAADQDSLQFSNDGSTMGNITGSYSAGVLTLSSVSATAVLAEWQAALRAVSYSNSSESPSTTPRQITLTINDGVADGAARSLSMDV
ncbi:MAG: hypothetical protein Q7N95_10235, partial [Alphaproteobacteria bacterium]|nr:hypothetical protein [Alphaproteobacteria bacterium]